MAKLDTVCFNDILKFLSLISRTICFQIAKKGLSKREIEIEELNDLGPYLARIGNPASISKTEAYLLRDDCLCDFKQVSVDKANRILRMIEKQTAELEKMQTLLTQVRRLRSVLVHTKPSFLHHIDVFSYNYYK